MQMARIFSFLTLGLLLAASPGRTCDPDHIEKITFTPGAAAGVNIAVGGTGTVDVAVTCAMFGGDIQGNQWRFDTRLVEEDGVSDDKMGTHTYSAPGPAGIPIRARAIYSFKTTLSCPNATQTITGTEDSGEGAPPCTSPAQLAVEIDEGGSEESANYGDGHTTKRWPSTDSTPGTNVPACCVAPAAKTAFFLDESRESYRTASGFTTVCGPGTPALSDEKLGGDGDACNDDDDAEDDDDDDDSEQENETEMAKKELEDLLEEADRLSAHTVRAAIDDITGDLSHLPFVLIELINEILAKTDMSKEDIRDYVNDLEEQFDDDDDLREELGGGNVPQAGPVGTVTLSGAGRWVDVTGPINADGTFVATGTGTVAGFPNISVRFTGRYLIGRLSGEYAVGVNGGLPGGQPINYIYNSPNAEWNDFWEALGDLLIQAGQSSGGVPNGMVDGVAYSEYSNAIAVQFMLAGHGLSAALDDDITPTVPARPAQRALFEIAGLYAQWADDVAASTLPSRVASEAVLRRLSARFETLGTLRRRMNALRQAAPLNADIQAGIDQFLQELSDVGRDLDSFSEAALGGQFASVSAADFTPRIAADAIVSGFGVGLANSVVAATELPLPTTVDDVSVRVTDATGESRLAGIFFGSAGQFNYHIPPETAPGLAVVTVFRDDVVLASGNVFVAPVAPSLFTANANGSGVPAALIQRVASDGTQTFEPVFEGEAGALTPKPIAFGDGDRLFLLLFGTGIRAGQNVVVRINGVEVPVLGSAAAPGFVGLDQVNAELLASLAGAGVVDVELIVEGEVANIVTLAFE